MYQEITYANFEDRYQNKQYIGAGGFGKVYKVFDYAKNHYVALKVADVRPEWKKFTLKNEVELVNKMPYHRNIARYDGCYRFNTGITGEMDFAILKFYEHGNLEQFLTREKLSLNDKKLIIQGILEGVSFLHKNSIIHRDLKAENVLLSREDGVWTPKITDFGLSRKILQDATITNSAIGLSYSYAAPEQILNKKIHRNVDLWATGVLIYRVIADELPFIGRVEGDDKTAQSQLELSKRIVNLDIPEKLNSIPEPYQTVIKRCLMLDPMERAQSPDELITILRNSGEMGKNGLPPQEEKTQLVSNFVDSSTNEQTVVDSNKEEANIPKPDQSEANKFSDESYQIPIDNPTIYHANPSSEAKEKEPELSNSYEPKSGAKERKFNVLWIVLPIVLGGIAFFSYWFFLKNPVQQIDANDSSIVEHIAINEPTVQNFDRLEALEEELKEANISNDTESFNSLQIELNDYLQDEIYSSNYRVNYLLAKSQLMLGKGNRASLKSLKLAVNIALSNEKSIELLNDLENDEEDDFYELSQLQGGKHWNKIKESLNVD